MDSNVNHKIQIINLLLFLYCLFNRSASSFAYYFVLALLVWEKKTKKKYKRKISLIWDLIAIKKLNKNLMALSFICV